jgi:uncharacterized protein YjbJ (UPF0337 family)
MDWKEVGSDQRQSQREVGKLSDHDLDVIKGNQEQLEGKIQERYDQERYDFAKDQIRKDIDDRVSEQKL